MGIATEVCVQEDLKEIMDDLAISTSWNSDRYTNGAELITELTSLGFNNFELGFSLTKEMVEDIFLFKTDHNIQIVSLHNYCPAPEGIDREKALPDCFSLSSTNEAERKKAVNLTKRSMDTAKRFDAKVLVLHCGRVEIKENTKILMRLYQEGRKETQEYKTLKDDLIKQRENKKAPFLDSIFRSLDELSNYAKSLGIFLGIENRIYYREIPSFDEIGLILNKFSDRNIFYWHDVGHAQVLENLGFNKYRDYLKKYADRMIGMHLHDVNGVNDHRAPLKGNFEFKDLLPYVKKDTLKVIEAHRPATPSELTGARKYLIKLFAGTL